jgi:hypothetical protein
MHGVFIPKDTRKDYYNIFRKSVNRKTMSYSIDDELIIFNGQDSKNMFLKLEYSTDLVGLSLHQLFCDAFNIHFEKKERQERLIKRQFHKEHYHPLFTIWGKSDGFTQGWEYGKRMNQVKEMLNLWN